MNASIRGYREALDDAINEHDAKQKLHALVDDLDKGGFTAAAKCLSDDLDALVVHPSYPPRHRRRWRSTNLLERSHGEVKRPTTVMGRFPGEESCLTLVWAVPTGNRNRGESTAAKRRHRRLATVAASHGRRQLEPSAGSPLRLGEGKAA